MEAGTITPVGERGSALHRSPAARLPDRLLKWGLTALSVGVIDQISGTTGYARTKIVAR